eukprot:jgi/Bigna1/74435/fgenesh1_pg.29_\
MKQPDSDNMEMSNMPVTNAAIVVSDEKSKALSGVVVQSQTSPACAGSVVMASSTASGAAETTSIQAADNTSKSASEIPSGDQSEFIKEFRKFLANGPYYGYPGTDGTFMSNFWAFLSQEHTLLSLRYANPVHPFSRRERLLFVFNSITWLFFLSALFANIDTHWALSAFFVALLTVPYNMIMRYLMECSCCIANDTMYSVGETFGLLIMMALGCGSLLWIILGIIFAVQAGEAFVRSWILSQVQSYVIQALLCGIYVLYYLPSSREKFQENCKKFLPDESTDIVNYQQVNIIGSQYVK